MSPQENRLFGHVHGSKDSLRSIKKNGAKAMRIEQCFGFRMYGLNPNQGARLTKIQALVKDCCQLRRSDHSFRVVVFTQSLCMHGYVVEALRREGLNPFSSMALRQPRNVTVRFASFRVHLIIVWQSLSLLSDWAMSESLSLPRRASI